MIDWLIIGGGVHGTHLSLYLTRRKGVRPEALRVLDPHPRPLALWHHHTINTGMEFLRSGHAHNLHFDPFSLVTFARTRAGSPLARFTDPYGRPALDLFNAHCAHLIERYRLDALRLLGRAEGLVRLRDGWRVETASGGIEARRVIIATGSTENPYWPDWALALRQAGAPVHHIFDPHFDRQALPAWDSAVVVGGGITAAQTALSLALERPGTVTLLMRHPARVHHFDAEPVWIDRRQLEPFHATRDYRQRRAIISGARHRGSIPPDVARELDSAVAAGLLNVRRDSVTDAQYAMPSPEKPGGVSLRLAGGSPLDADCLILATGFATNRPGGGWLDQAAAAYGLPLAPDGFPLVDPRLCWVDGLYVTGSLAELEVGPVARNIIGARLAAERIGDAL